MSKSARSSDLYSLTSRPGASPGRRRRPENEGLAGHGPRPPHDPKHRVHVWNVRVADGPSLRSDAVKKAIVAKIAELKDRGPRLLRYAITDDTIFLLCEAKTSADLSRRVQLLFTRITFAVNQLLGRSGSLFRGRHHREELTTPALEKKVVAEFYTGSGSAPGPHADDAAALRPRAKPR